MAIGSAFSVMLKRAMLGALYLSILCLSALAPAARAQCDNSVAAPTPDHRFELRDGLVLDKETGLEWQRCVVGALWLSTEESCSEPVTGLRTWWQVLTDAQQQPEGWRLPNKKELASIVDYRCVAPAANRVVFPNTPAGLYWSSTPVVYGSSQAWAIDFSDGAFLTLSVGEPAYTRWVRDVAP